MALRIDGAQDDGNGLTILQVHDDGSVSAPVGDGATPSSSGGGGGYTGPIYERLSASGAVSPTIPYSLLSSGDDAAWTLEDGTVNDYEKRIGIQGNGDTATSLTANLYNGTAYTTFSLDSTSAFLYLTLRWSTDLTAWVIVEKVTGNVQGSFSNPG